MDENISQKADELRKSLRNARQGKTEDPSTGNEPQPDGSFSTDASSSDVQRYAATSNQSDRATEPTSNTGTSSSNYPAQSAERLVHGQDQRSIQRGGTASKPQGTILSSLRSLAQDHQRERPEPRRSGEDNPTYRSDGIDVSHGSTGPTRSPKRIGNLERNEKEEPNFVPPRFFRETDTSSRQQERQEPHSIPTPTTPQPTNNGTPQPRKRGRPSHKELAERAKQQQASNPQILSFPQGQATEPENNLNLKEKISSFIPHGGSKLTAREADAMRDPLYAALEDEFEMLDKLLLGYAGEPSLEEGGRPIWSDASEKEMNAFVKSFLSLGQKNAFVAGAARTAVDAGDFIIGVTFMAPRLTKTGQIIRQAREHRAQNRPQRQRRGKHFENPSV